MVTDFDVDKQLKQNIAQLEQRIQSVCHCAGRKRDSVTLVAITKYVETSVVRKLFDTGLHVFGESRPQVLWEKAPALPQAEWHLVGHLQRNKVTKTLPLAKLIHSVDSERLLQTIDEEAKRINRVQDILLEFHLTDEPEKHGFEENEGPQLPALLQALQNVRVLGLMCMAALNSTSEEARSTFQRLRTLRDQLSRLFPPPHELHHLSMGMTHDFEEAIIEGATIVRIGSALFEGIPHKE
jgi:pyridoxal phosphate enzyme (YggS family)